MSVSCPLPAKALEKILLSHGSGGKLTSQLIEKIFLPTFGTSGEPLHDGAKLKFGPCEFAFTTDSFVVRPLFFPGGNIGDLAVNGTVNDLAMCGARPLYLSCAFILEEGFAVADLIRITESMRMAALKCGVKIVTGDTKVVERGKGDGIYINTSGVGTIEMPGIGPEAIEPGDVVIVNGEIGLHGTAIMSVREGLEFETEVQSDTQELYSLVHALKQAEIPVSCLRDLTRGGLATSLVEIAESGKITIDIAEGSVPVGETVRGAAEFLGLDPLYIACEGRMALFIKKSGVEKALGVLSACGHNPAIIGTVSEAGSALVTAKTCAGTTRILDKLTGDQLPRIC